MKWLVRNHNFLFLFLGRLVTNIGDSIYYVAAMWLVYDLGGNAFYSGLAGFLTMLPMALQFLTGPFVDRWPIKKVLISTQLLQCFLIFLIPLTYYFDVLTVQLVLIIMPIVSFIEQFAYPAQTKALPIVLKKDDLVKGNSLFSFAYQGVDLVFNAISGILIVSFGAITLFLADSITFAVAILLFAVLKFPKQAIKKSNQKKTAKDVIKSYTRELKEGFSIVFHSLLATFLLGSVLCNFAIGAAQAVLPAYADYQGGAQWYGFYLAALSIGSLIGALISSLFGKLPLGKLTILAFAIGGILWIVSPFSSSTLFGVILFGLAWIPVGATNVLFAAVIQTIVPNNFLGRINSITRSMSVVAMPIGSLAGGYLASVFSPQFIFSITGSGILFVSVVWLLHPTLRKLPRVANMDAATFRLRFKEKEPNVVNEV
ncbi:MFS transporter [Oceanobacillus halophilus]|uniref:MFS transporter n=1 Tax=Oceanobacillus halophilus TaxID=930130 RepID=A0A495A4I1_9BACI|nr:MFS transporter [Oceanobacillus halophilus]RKQ34597.1 MFS transporter [Oceanobacillus halophilus]